MEDIASFFRESQDIFTIYVVEQRFVVGRGLEYFKSFKGKENLLDNNAKIKKRVRNILSWLQKNTPNISELVQMCFLSQTKLGIVEVINSLNKLFSVQQHQAVGPEVIDPIIIQEGNVSKKYIAQIVSLHEKSILQPTIIILLKDNDFERAKALFSNCPHGINIKMIRNSGEAEIYKVINTGAEKIESFIDAFSYQCFSTCSHTPRHLLLNEEWSNNSIIRYYSPSLLKIRTNLMYDEKEEAREEINEIILQLQTYNIQNNKDLKLLKGFECTAKLMRVFCNDSGLQDMKDAYDIAKELDNDILRAQVYRYSYFFQQYTIKEQCESLKVAEDIFYKSKMEDQAVYCNNNRLTYQFETNHINTRDFKKLQERAINNVPGLVGMSHILNNTGVAYLMTGNPDKAFEYFDKGLDYAHNQERGVQKAAIKCNYMIAKSYCFEKIPENDFRKNLNFIFDTMGTHKLPFIAIRLVMNLISIAFKQDKNFAIELLKEYHIKNLLEKGVNSNIMGSAQLKMQMQYLDNKYKHFNLYNSKLFSNGTDNVSGIQKKYIQKYGLNPFVFCTWL